MDAEVLEYCGECKTEELQDQEDGLKQHLLKNKVLLSSTSRDSLRDRCGKFLRSKGDGTLRLEHSFDRFGCEEIFALHSLTETRVLWFRSGKIINDQNESWVNWPARNRDNGGVGTCFFVFFGWRSVRTTSPNQGRAPESGTHGPGLRQYPTTDAARSPRGSHSPRPHRRLLRVSPRSSQRACLHVMIIQCCH